MTKLSIFDKIEEAKKSTGLSENDNIEHFWHNWKSEKNIGASQKMTKLGVFDKFEEAQKYTGLSENDKMGNFWQYWKSGNYTGLSLYGQNWAFLTKLKKWKNTQAGLSENDEKGGWRWIAERQVASDKVLEGGHLSIFSPFLSLLFCFKDRRPSCGRSG